MAVAFSADPNTFLILSNLALASGILYLLLYHHRETHKPNKRK